MIIGIVIAGCILVVLYARKKNYSLPSSLTGGRAFHAAHSAKSPPKPAVKPVIVKTDNSWWKPNPNSYLDAIKKSINYTNPANMSGKGPTDSLVVDASQNVITQDDIANYVTEYENITDQSVTSAIDPASGYDASSDFNDPKNSIQTSDNVQYNLFANPDENNFEVITSKQLYDKSEYPAIVDDQFQNHDVTYYMDDSTNVTYATPRDSINNSENIDPSLTDGIVYFPENNDINNQNLFDLIRETINDRATNTQSVFLENSVMDDSVFTIS